MLLTIDVRKAFDTGIGTYIRQLVPRVIRRLPDDRIEVIVMRGEARRHVYLDDCTVRFIEIAAAPLSVGEQWELGRLMHRDRIFWATSLAHPLLAGGSIVNTVFDLAQLALPASLGGSRRLRLLARPFFERIRHRSSRVLFLSDFTAREFRRLVGEPKGPSQVIPPGVDERWFDMPSDAPPSPLADPYFVMLGNLRPHKNLALVLKALEIAAPRLPHRLLVIGPDAVDARSAAAADPLLQKLADRIVYAGSLEQVAVQSALRHAEALLFPSFYEGFGLPVLEAMACGCPVIVARNGISPQLAGAHYLTFYPTDANGLAEMMVEQAAMDGADRARMIRLGISRARQFSWDRTAEQTSKALRTTARHLRRSSRRMGSGT